MATLFHVGLEHGVEAHAGEGDAGVEQYVRVVLQVVSDLAVRLALEQRLQGREHPRALELVGRARVDVRERHVGGRSRLERERDADDLGVHVVEARGLGVEGEQLRLAQALEPALEILPARDCLVVALDDG